MFSKSFFKFFFGFLVMVIFGLLGATFSSRYFSAHEDMFANIENNK
jgi:hypothetical protein